MFISRLLDYITMKWLYQKSLINNHSAPQLAVHSNDYIGASISLYGMFEKEYIERLQKLFDQLDIPYRLLIDCGANIGNHAIHLGSRFQAVVAIEPHPRNYDILAVNCRGSKYKLIRMAASSAPGEMLLSGFASNMGATKIVQAAAKPQASAADNDTALAIPVEVQRLDDMIAADAAVDAIKIDVEGHELQVLQGATKILEQRPLIIFEQIAWDTATADETAASFLQKLGYQFITLKANDPLEPGSKLQKIVLLASSILAGPKMSVELRDAVSREETFPCIVALHPRQYIVNEGLLSCLL